MKTEAVDAVLRALLSGELGADDLGARPLAAFLGKTTSVLYHHFGSLDGFLHDVAQAGYGVLAARVAGGPAPLSWSDVAVAYVDFALDHPALYGLMFERRIDWAALRRVRPTGDSAGLGLLRATAEAMRAAGHPDPETAARVLYGGLHGLASLAITGRANAGDLSLTDREAAHRAARLLVRSLLEKP